MRPIALGGAYRDDFEVTQGPRRTHSRGGNYCHQMPPLFSMTWATSHWLGSAYASHSQRHKRRRWPNNCSAFSV